MIIWGITTLDNLILCLLLLYRGHHERYRVLFASLTYELLAAPTLYFIYAHFGTHSDAYATAYHAKQMGSLVFDFGIIFEAWRWRNRAVRLPVEIYLLAKLAAFLAEHSNFVGIGDGIHEVLRYANLGIILWFMMVFRNPPPYRMEKHHER